ncbi:MAG: 5-deoxy-glucuronate isomerase, partial [Ilumatobacteraceae bacterium]
MTPEEAGWRHLAFETVTLAAGERHTGRADGRETAITVLAGSGTVTAGDL